ncbi:hypothetical protein DRQ36_09600, partial [bacterium]
EIGTNGYGIYFTGSTMGNNAGRFYSSGNRIYVRSEDTDNVAQFASYGLYLPRDVSTGLYCTGGARFNYADAGDEVYIQNGTGRVGIGTTSPSAKLHVHETSGSTTDMYNGYVGALIGSGAGGAGAYCVVSTADRRAVYGVTNGSSDYAANTGYSTVWHGGWIVTTYSDAAGLVGRCDNGGYGVYGYAYDGGSLDAGIVGSCENTGSDWAGYFFGDIYADWYYDIAEMYPDDGEIPECALVALSQPSDDPMDTRIGLCTKPYDSGLIGVKSENPAILLGPTEHAGEYREDQKELLKLKAGEKRPDETNPVWARREEIEKQTNPKAADDPGSPIALAGRVRVLATTENGPIKPGDPITSSSKPGYGMKATEAGPIIGFAMSSLDDGDGKIVVNVSRTYYTPPVQSNQSQSGSQQVFDGGTAKMTGNEMWVSFSDDFSSQLIDNITPIITITPNCPSVVLCITEKTSNGFKVVGVSGDGELSFDWIAMARIK